MDISGISAYTDYVTSTANMDQATSKVNSTISTDYANASDEELMDACKQFESYLMEQVYKQMEKTVPKSDEDDTYANLVDYFGDSVLQDISAESTEKNGLGIAQQLYEQMKRNYDL